MTIAGFQKLSLLDYPDKLSAVIFTLGCNFKCPYCYNIDLVQPSLYTQNFSHEDVFSFLKKRQGTLDGIVITGGEPTLQKDLINFIKKIKSQGFLVKLDTNGSNPDILQKVINQRLVDYIAMDIKTQISKYESTVETEVNIKNIQKSINLLLENKVDYEFRTTVVPHLVDKSDFEEIAKLISGAKKYFLQQFRNQRTLDPKLQKVMPYSKEKLLEFSEIMKKTVDEVKIRGL